MNDATPSTPIAQHIWDSRYRYLGDGARRDETIQDTWRRIARALAAVEASDAAAWQECFYEELASGRFLPAGRIQHGAGTDKEVTLFNCFVMGIIEDSMEAIFDHLKEGAITMQHGGGVGYDFSTLRPRGSPALSSGRIASGVVPFMKVWDRMCATVLSTGARRGAMMATLRCDHPDIEAFVDAKAPPNELTNFNLSVQITDAFLDAVNTDEDWPLVFPLDAAARDDQSIETVVRRWTGRDEAGPCRILRRVGARGLWNRIMRATYDNAEPGVLFVDRVNQMNNLWYCEHITATNPCGEIPLPPYGACDLGSLNLARFVKAPFSDRAFVDMDGIRATARIAARMLDDVIDVSRFPLPQQEERVKASRRIGLGITGLGDMLIMLGLRYDRDEARAAAAEVMREICHAAYRASIGLARDRGPFPQFDRERYMEGAFIAALPEDIQDGIRKHGIRNSHLTAIAPAGTISLLADNVSSGIEPVYSFRQTRQVLERDGSRSQFELEDFAYRLWRTSGGSVDELPEAFIDASHIAPEDHLAMQGALQPFVDNSISKTVNVPEDYAFADFRALYRRAYDFGLKGCTTYRPTPARGRVIGAGADFERKAVAGPEPAVHCCTIDREAD